MKKGILFLLAGFTVLYNSCSYVPFNKETILASAYLSEMTLIKNWDTNNSQNESPIDFLIFYETTELYEYYSSISIYERTGRSSLYFDTDQFSEDTNGFTNAINSDQNNLTFDFLYRRTMIPFAVNHSNIAFFESSETKTLFFGLSTLLLDNSFSDKFLIPRTTDVYRPINARIPKLLYYGVTGEEIENTDQNYISYKLEELSSVSSYLFDSETGNGLTKAISSYLRIGAADIIEPFLMALPIDVFDIKTVLFIESEHYDNYADLNLNGDVDEQVILVTSNDARFIGGDLDLQPIVSDSIFTFSVYISLGIFIYDGVSSTPMDSGELYPLIFEIEVPLNSAEIGGFNLNECKISNAYNATNPDFSLIESGEESAMNENILNSVDAPYFNKIGALSLYSWKESETGYNRSIVIEDLTPDQIEFPFDADFGSSTTGITIHADDPDVIVIEALDTDTIISRKLDAGGNNTYYFTNKDLDYKSAIPVTIGNLKYMKAEKNSADIWEIYFSYLYSDNNDSSSSEIYTIYKITLPLLLEVAQGKS